MPPRGFNASFLLGVRYMKITEELNYESFQFVNPSATTPTLSMLTATSNTLVGPQIGGFFEIYSVPNCWITFEMKGAICGNNARQGTTGFAPIINSAQIFDESKDRIVTAFVGDLELMLNWRITSHCVTRFGYQAMWVDGLALAARNFGPPATILEQGPAPLDSAGRVAYHGPHLGLEITW
jgi:hypothetical protein